MPLQSSFKTSKLLTPFGLRFHAQQIITGMVVCGCLLASYPASSLAEQTGSETHSTKFESIEQQLNAIFEKIKKDVSDYAAAHNGEIPLWDGDDVEFENLAELVTDDFWEDVHNTVFIRGQANEYVRMIQDLSPKSAKALSAPNFKGQGFDDVMTYFDLNAEIEALKAEEEASERRRVALKRIANIANSIANEAD